MERPLSHRRTANVTLLGPQANGGLHAGSALKELGITGPVALITAGWQERETEDAVLSAALGVETVNLRLHGRSEELFAADPDFAAAYKARQTRLRHIQSFYRIRLESADDAARAIAVRHVSDQLIAEEWEVSINHFRHIDADHIARCREVHLGFRQEWKAEVRPVRDRQIKEVRGLLGDVGALVIAGGHVGSLLNRLRLFDVIEMSEHLPIVAWSAGAMVLTDRIVCFHDFPPYGTDIAQIFDVGYGLAPGIVVLPDPQRRVRLDDTTGISRFASRMSPAMCVAMDYGSELRFAAPSGTDALLPQARPLAMSGHAYHLTSTGHVDKEWRR